MQSYKAPVNDMKFILKDFLNSGASDFLFKDNEFELEDLNFISDSVKINYKYFAPQGFFIYDTRDIYANPTKGILIKQAFSSRIDISGKAQNNFTWIQSFSIYKRLSSLDNQKPWILAVGAKSQMNFGVKDQQFLAAMGESGSVRGWHYPNALNYNDSKQIYRFGFHNLKSSIAYINTKTNNLYGKNIFINLRNETLNKNNEPRLKGNSIINNDV